MVAFSRRRKEGPGVNLGNCKVLHITERAIKVEVLDGPHAGMGAEGEEACFIPKSQIHPDSELNDESFLDTEGELVVTAWFAGQRGWK